MSLGRSEITSNPSPIPFPASLRSEDSDPSNKSHINRDEKKLEGNYAIRGNLFLKVINHFSE